MKLKQSPEDLAYKDLARQKINLAVRRGHVERGVCEWENCASTITEAHHPDYTKPLEVTWLCSAHHHTTHDIVGIIPVPIDRPPITFNPVGKPKIQDQYTDLPISRQRKWELRNREKANELKRKQRKRRKEREELTERST